jgi:hypothetical protein
MIENAIRQKIYNLIDRSARIAPRTGGLPWDSQHMALCQGWITEALSIIRLAVPVSDSPYRTRVEQIAAHGPGSIVDHVAGIGQILGGLLRDIDAGLMSSVTNKVRAETFDDLLDHAESYLQEDRKNPAGVIAGVVFEDTIRRICRNHNIVEPASDLDRLINALETKGIIKGQQRAQALVAALVRSKATHALWDEFDKSGVEATIQITKQLLCDHLGG